MKREATPMKQYLGIHEEKNFANNREKKIPLGGISNLKTDSKLREENTPKPTENATIKVQSNNVNLVTESKEMNKTSAKNSKDKPKAPKKSPFMKSDRKMNVYSSLVYKNKMKQEAKARREAEELAKLPKEPVKRFFAKLAPKRVIRNLFSKKGLFMLLKFGAAMFLLAIIAVGGLFLYFKKDLDEIRLDQMKVTGTVNTYLDRNGQTLWEDKGDGDYRLVVDGDNISLAFLPVCKENGFVRGLDKCYKTPLSIQALLENEERKLDYGIVEGQTRHRRFVVGAGMGFDAAVWFA